MRTAVDNWGLYECSVWGAGRRLTGKERVSEDGLGATLRGMASCTKFWQC